jgi:murein DD-endopeptidase MepM/ murein hydrolase activator NlpD
MRSRRRRVRDETVAPWLTLAVILALWWGASAFVQQATPHSAGGPVPPAFDDITADSSRRPPDDEAAARADDSGRDSVAESPPSTLATETNTDDQGPLVPVAGIPASSLTSSFHEARGGGARRHEAMDILAPRGTPVLAAVDGRVVKLFLSAAGGLTIYQFDDDERHCYYYAHLDSYAPDLNEGQEVVRGQVIGYVGTSGNAPPGTPHLHFAIHRLGPEKRWWEGEPLDPIEFLR